MKEVVPNRAGTCKFVDGEFSLFPMTLIRPQSGTMHRKIAFTKYTLAAFCVGLLAVMVSESAGALPDLKINRNLLVRSVEVQFRDFSADSCAVIEGCVPGPGFHKIMMFDASIANIGTGDLKIGDPAARTNLFHFSECHGHYHMKGFSSYRLLNSSGTEVRRSRKQGFCLRDNRPFLADAPPASGYDCDNQGISRGWQDIYDKSLDCQFLDVTGIPPGRYQLQIIVNPLRLLKESNYDNNAVTVPVTIPRLH